MVDQRDNVHISYDLQVRPYHSVVADLAAKYTVDGGRILDVGCGTGNTLQLIRKANAKFELVGADIDGHCLKIADERARLDGKIAIDDVADLFDGRVTARFDTIVMSHVLEHVYRPYDTVLGLMELVKPGGHLILAVPNPVRLDVAISYLFRRFHRVNKGHVQTWDPAHWRNFLEQILQLDVVEYPTDFIRIPRVDQIGALQPALRRLALAFPGFALSCMAVVRKA